MYQPPPFGSYRIYPYCYQGCKHYVSYYIVNSSQGVHKVEKLWTREEMLEKIPESHEWEHLNMNHALRDAMEQVKQHMSQTTEEVVQHESYEEQKTNEPVEVNEEILDSWEDA